VKTKTIEKIIGGVVHNWAKSIKDSYLREKVVSETIVTGGCITSMLLNEEINDFDIYIRDPAFCEQLAIYYVDQFKNNKDHKVVPTIRVRKMNDQVKIFIKSAGAIGENAEGYSYFEGTTEEQADQYVASLSVKSLPGGDKHTPIFLSQNAITLTGDIQLVTRFTGDPEQIHKNYDFVHCTNYWTGSDHKLHLNQEALTSLLEKDLKYTGSLYPLASVIRTRKFIQRGWTCTAGQYLKMIMQLNDMDLTDIQVLEEQLTGVDVAYFIEFLAALKNRVREGDIDRTYIMKLMEELL
jgi:hypothetical protein